MADGQAGPGDITTEEALGTLASGRDEYIRLHQEDRLGVGPVLRCSLACTSAFLLGLGLGSSQGATMAGLRFRAENSHRFPTSQRGWYFYHKTKNYHVALGAVKEGLRMGLRQTFWVGVFMLTENAVDSLRDSLARGRKNLVGSSDLGSSIVAGLATAGAYSLTHRFPVPTAARIARLGLLAGFCYGGIQDVLSVAMGRHVGYVGFIKRAFSPSAGPQQEVGAVG